MLVNAKNVADIGALYFLTLNTFESNYKRM